MQFLIFFIKILPAALAFFLPETAPVNELGIVIIYLIGLFIKTPEPALRIYRFLSLK